MAFLLMLGALAGCEMTAEPGAPPDAATADAGTAADADHIRGVQPTDAVQLRGNEVRLLLLRRGR